jgi:hypothetical protein
LLASSRLFVLILFVGGARDLTPRNLGCIGQLLEHHAVGAYEDTLRALDLADRDDQLKMTVAKLIIEFAKEGERDPVRLRDLVLKTVRPNKP